MSFKTKNAIDFFLKTLSEKNQKLKAKIHGIGFSV